jgi:ribosomal protein S18 acetylase RimI-like enzyme
LRPDVLEDLARLRPDVPLADQPTLRVDGHVAGHEDQPLALDRDPGRERPGPLPKLDPRHGSSLLAAAIIPGRSAYHRAMPTVRIRPGVEADAPALGQLHVRSWQWAYRGMLPDDYLDGLAEQTGAREQMWHQIIRELQADQPLWVAERDGRVAGFCNTGPARDQPAGTAELLSIYLDPDVVGTGVGAALMQQALDDMRQRGYRAAVLWVLEANDRARRFYERFGWQTDGVVKDDTLWGVTIRELRYRVELDG